jgi:hypothetical protein
MDVNMFKLFENRCQVTPRCGAVACARALQHQKLSACGFSFSKIDIRYFTFRNFKICIELTTQDQARQLKFTTRAVRGCVLQRLGRFRPRLALRHISQLRSVMNSPGFFAIFGML